MKVQLHTSVDTFDALQVEWNDLLARSLTDTPFSTFEWHKHWWNAYQPGDLWIITVRDEADILRGIASLFIESTNGQRNVHFVGCEDVTDYLDFIVDRDFAPEVYQSFIDAFLTYRDQFDTLDLCNIPETTQTYQAFPQKLEESGFVVTSRCQEVCPVIQLPSTFDGYLELLDKKQAKEVSRKLRIAEGQGDSVRWYIVDETHDLHLETDKFIKLMASSHPEKAAFLQNDQHRAFFHSLIPAAFEAGWLQLNFLEVASEPVATYLNFDYNNHIMVYNSGLEPNKSAALSPGIVLLSYNIQHAIETKHAVFDFLRGDEQYKYRMGGVDTRIFNIQAQLK